MKQTTTTSSSSSTHRCQRLLFLLVAVAAGCVGRAAAGGGGGGLVIGPSPLGGSTATPTWPRYLAMYMEDRVVFENGTSSGASSTVPTTNTSTASDLAADRVDPWLAPASNTATAAFRSLLAAAMPNGTDDDPSVNSVLHRGASINATAALRGDRHTVLLVLVFATANASAAAHAAFDYAAASAWLTATPAFARLSVGAVFPLAHPTQAAAYVATAAATSSVVTPALSTRQTAYVADPDGSRYEATGTSTAGVVLACLAGAAIIAVAAVLARSAVAPARDAAAPALPRGSAEHSATREAPGFAAAAAAMNGADDATAVSPYSDANLDPDCVAAALRQRTHTDAVRGAHLLLGVYCIELSDAGRSGPPRALGSALSHDGTSAEAAAVPIPLSIRHQATGSVETREAPTAAAGECSHSTADASSADDAPQALVCIVPHLDGTVSIIQRATVADQGASAADADSPCSSDADVPEPEIMHLRWNPEGTEGGETVEWGPRESAVDGDGSRYEDDAPFRWVAVPTTRRGDGESDSSRVQLVNVASQRALGRRPAPNTNLATEDQQEPSGRVEAVAVVPWLHPPLPAALLTLHRVHVRHDHDARFTTENGYGGALPSATAAAFSKACYEVGIYRAPDVADIGIERSTAKESGDAAHASPLQPLRAGWVSIAAAAPSGGMGLDRRCGPFGRDGSRSPLRPVRDVVGPPSLLADTSSGEATALRFAPGADGGWRQQFLSIPVTPWSSRLLSKLSGAPVTETNRYGVWERRPPEPGAADVKDRHAISVSQISCGSAGDDCVYLAHNGTWQATHADPNDGVVTIADAAQRFSPDDAAFRFRVLHHADACPSPLGARLNRVLGTFAICSTAMPSLAMHVADGVLTTVKDADLFGSRLANLFFFSPNGDGTHRILAPETRHLLTYVPAAGEVRSRNHALRNLLSASPSGGAQAVHFRPPAVHEPSSSSSSFGGGSDDERHQRWILVSALRSGFADEVHIIPAAAPMLCLTEVCDRSGESAVALRPAHFCRSSSWRLQRPYGLPNTVREGPYVVQTVGAGVASLDRCLTFAASHPSEGEEVVDQDTEEKMAVVPRWIAADEARLVMLEVPADDDDGAVFASTLRPHPSSASAGACAAAAAAGGGVAGKGVAMPSSSSRAGRVLGIRRTVDYDGVPSLTLSAALPLPVGAQTQQQPCSPSAEGRSGDLELQPPSEDAAGRVVLCERSDRKSGARLAFEHLEEGAPSSAAVRVALRPVDAAAYFAPMPGDELDPSGTVNPAAERARHELHPSPSAGAKTAAAAASAPTQARGLVLGSVLPVALGLLFLLLAVFAAMATDGRERAVMPSLVLYQYVTHECSNSSLAPNPVAAATVEATGACGRVVGAWHPQGARTWFAAAECESRGSIRFKVALTQDRCVAQPWESLSTVTSCGTEEGVAPPRGVGFFFGGNFVDAACVAAGDVAGAATAAHPGALGSSTRAVVGAISSGGELRTSPTLLSDPGAAASEAVIDPTAEGIITSVVDGRRFASPPAGADHIRIPDVRGSAADVGEEHMTASVWVRVGPTAEGFVVATAHDWTATLMPSASSSTTTTSNGSLSTTPILAALRRLAVAPMGRDVEAAFTLPFAYPWAAFFAVYVSGAASTVTVVAAGAGDGESERLEWRVPELFDGQAHLISVRTASRRHRGRYQLFLDGTTRFRGADSGGGWQRCMARRAGFAAFASHPGPTAVGEETTVPLKYATLAASAVRPGPALFVAVGLTGSPAGVGAVTFTARLEAESALRQAAGQSAAEATSRTTSVVVGVVQCVWLLAVVIAIGLVAIWAKRTATAKIATGRAVAKSGGRVRFKGLPSSSAPSSKPAPATGASGQAHAIFLDVLGTCQAVDILFTGIGFPLTFTVPVGWVILLPSLDLSIDVWFGAPALVTPLLQLMATVALVAVGLRVLAADNARFIARAPQQADEATQGKGLLEAPLAIPLPSLAAPLGALYDVKYTAEAGSKEAVAITSTADVAVVATGLQVLREPDSNLAAAANGRTLERVRLSDDQLSVQLTLSDTDGVAGLSLSHDREARAMATAEGGAVTVAFKPLAKCPVHQDTRLVKAQPEQQQRVAAECLAIGRQTPYACVHREMAFRHLRPSACSTDAGFYTCPECTFTVCGPCSALGLKDKLLAAAATKRHQFRDTTLLVGFIIVAGIEAVYVPVLKSALMVVTCHPDMQCTFPACYAEPTGLFVAAVALAVCVLVAVGLAVPAYMCALLLQRKRALVEAVFAPLDAAEAASDRNGASERPADGPPVDATRRLSWLTIATYACDDDEWSHVLKYDGSVLKGLYATFELRYMALPPVLLVARLALVTCVVAAPPDSVAQLAVTAVVQSATWTLMAVTEPYIDLQIDHMSKASGAHLSGLLALQAFFRTYQHEAIGGVMLATTTAYALFLLYVIAKIVRSLRAAKLAARVALGAHVAVRSLDEEALKAIAREDVGRLMEANAAGKSPLQVAAELPSAADAERMSTLVWGTIVAAAVVVDDDGNESDTPPTQSSRASWPKNAATATLGAAGVAADAPACAVLTAARRGLALYEEMREVVPTPELVELGIVHALAAGNQVDTIKSMVAAARKTADDPDAAASQLVNAQRRSDGRRPLHVAAAAGRGRMVTLLLELGAEPSEDDQMPDVRRDCRRPADLAASEGHVHIVKLLFEHMNANTAPSDDENDEEGGGSDVSYSEECRGSDFSSDLLHDAAAADRVDVVRWAFEEGGYMRVGDLESEQRGCSVVGMAARHGSTATLRYLLRTVDGFTFRESACYPYNGTVINEAIANGHGAAAEAILSSVVARHTGVTHAALPHATWDSLHEATRRAVAVKVEFAVPSRCALGADTLPLATATVPASFARDICAVHIGCSDEAVANKLSTDGSLIGMALDMPHLAIVHFGIDGCPVFGYRAVDGERLADVARRKRQTGAHDYTSCCERDDDVRLAVLWKYPSEVHYDALKDTLGLFCEERIIVTFYTHAGLVAGAVASGAVVPQRNTDITLETLMDKDLLHGQLEPLLPPPNWAVATEPVVPGDDKEEEREAEASTVPDPVFFVETTTAASAAAAAATRHGPASAAAAARFGVGGSDRSQWLTDGLRPVHDELRDSVLSRNVDAAVRLIVGSPQIARDRGPDGRGLLWWAWGADRAQLVQIAELYGADAEATDAFGLHPVWQCAAFSAEDERKTTVTIGDDEPGAPDEPDNGIDVEEGPGRVTALVRPAAVSELYGPSRMVADETPSSTRAALRSTAAGVTHNSLLQGMLDRLPSGPSDSRPHLAPVLRTIFAARDVAALHVFVAQWGSLDFVGALQATLTCLSTGWLHGLVIGLGALGRAAGTAGDALWQGALASGDTSNSQFLWQSALRFAKVERETGASLAFFVGTAHVHDWLAAAKVPFGTMQDRRRDGQTPLHVAAARGDINAVRWLLRAQPEDAYAVDSQRHLPVHLAMLRNHASIVDVFRKEFGLATSLSSLHTEETPSGSGNCTPQSPLELVLRHAIQRAGFAEQPVPPMLQHLIAMYPEDLFARGTDGELPVAIAMAQDTALSNLVAQTLLNAMARKIKNDVEPTETVAVTVAGMRRRFTVEDDVLPLSDHASAPTNILLKRFDDEESVAALMALLALHPDRKRVLSERPGGGSSGPLMAAETPLTVAATIPRGVYLRALLDAGADTLPANADGLTPIAVAVGTRADANATLLAEYPLGGVNTVPANGKPPLLLAAAMSYNWDLMRVLVDKGGADPNQRNTEDLTPLAVILMEGRDPKTYDTLLDIGGDATAIVLEGEYSMLHCATGLENSSDEDRKKVLDMLLDANASHVPPATGTDAIVHLMRRAPQVAGALLARGRPPYDDLTRVVSRQGSLLANILAARGDVPQRMIDAIPAAVWSPELVVRELLPTCLRGLQYKPLVTVAVRLAGAEAGVRAVVAEMEATEGAGYFWSRFFDRLASAWEGDFETEAAGAVFSVLEAWGAVAIDGSPTALERATACRSAAAAPRMQWCAELFEAMAEALEGTGAVMQEEEMES